MLHDPQTANMSQDKLQRCFHKRQHDYAVPCHQGGQTQSNTSARLQTQETQHWIQCWPAAKPRLLAVLLTACMNAITFAHCVTHCCLLVMPRVCSLLRVEGHRLSYIQLELSACHASACCRMCCSCTCTAVLLLLNEQYTPNRHHHVTAPTGLAVLLQPLVLHVLPVLLVMYSMYCPRSTACTECCRTSTTHTQ